MAALVVLKYWPYFTRVASHKISRQKTSLRIDGWILQQASAILVKNGWTSATLIRNGWTTLWMSAILIENSYKILGANIHEGSIVYNLHIRLNAHG